MARSWSRPHGRGRRLNRDAGRPVLPVAVPRPRGRFVRPHARAPRVKRRDHPTLEAARRALTANGYVPACVPPPEPRQQWIAKNGKGPVYAIQREDRPRSQVWHIVEAWAVGDGRRT